MQIAQALILVEQTAPCEAGKKSKTRRAACYQRNF